MADQKQKISLKDIFNRNLVIVLLVQIFSDMSLSMANSFLNMGATAAGVSVAAIGIASSVYTLAAMFVRMPAGSLADSDKKKIGLMGVIAFRAAAIFFLGTFGITGDTNHVIARGLYGIAWSFCGVVLPATVAMMMDRKVMGSTYAVLALVQQFTKEMSKALGVKVYQSSGIIVALVVASAFAAIAIILVNFLDFNDPRVKMAAPKEKKSVLKSLNFRYIPVCLVLSLAVFSWTLCNNYNNVLAQERAIDLASILVVTGTISSVLGFVTSALCDFIHPKYVLVALYLCLSAGVVVLGGASDYTMFMIGMVLCTVGQSYSRIISIFLFKNCDPTEKGSVQATNFFATDILSIGAGALVGALVSNFGYAQGYTITAMTSVAAAVIVLLFGNKLMHIKHAE